MRRLIIATTVVSFLLLLGVASASAAAASAWWHLRVEPLPTYIHGGVARSEVQELRVNAVSGEVLWAVAANPFGEHVSFAYDASHEEVQSALEGVYGAGNVEVTGECKEEVPPLSECAYKIMFEKALGGRPVALPGAYFEDAGVFGGSKLEGEADAVEATSARTDGEILVTASNLGDASASGATEPITLSDVLPAGLEAVGVTGGAFEGESGTVGLACSLQGENGVNGPACSFTGVLPAYAGLSMHVLVDDVGASGEIFDRASVSGGGAIPASVSRPILLGEATPFGVSDYELVNENEGGGVDTQAGSHPFQQTTTIVLNQSVEPEHPTFGVGGSYPNGLVEPAAIPKDLHFFWPAGLVGDPAAVPQCPPTVFLSEKHECPADTAVGVARILLSLGQGGPPYPHEITESLFSLAPDPGEPARFAFKTPTGPVYIDPSVRGGREDGITVNVDNTTQDIGVRSSEVTVWGVPGAAIHDGFRGNACLVANHNGQPCSASGGEEPSAFLSMPTYCGAPLESTVTGDSWLEPEPDAEQEQLARFPMGSLDGCARLPFKPSLVVTPDSNEASKPSGLNVDVHVPQQETLSPGGLAVADARNITVTLPEGVAVNPSSGDGLQACNESLIGYEGSRELPGSEPGVQTPTFKGYLPGTIAARAAVEEHVALESENTFQPGLNFCANAAKLGEVTIKTPLLPADQPLKGSVYLASQESNPFGSLIAMYLVAEDPVSGTLVKLAGKVNLSPTGQLTATFENSPQAPFEDAEIHFFGGERAPLATPAHCGSYTTTAAFTPWSATAQEPPVIATSSFNIETGPNGTACPGASLPFKPTVTGGAENVNAGAFSPFTATFSRVSGEQNMQSIQVVLPPGLSGILSNVELCPEPQANEGECGANSLIGETTVSVGVGGEPYTDSGGKFYLTGPYNGTGSCTTGTPGCAPFGITFEVPAKAGPFDLANTKANKPPCDCIVVRGKIEINPITAAITITSNPPGTPDSIPTSIEGIPLEIQHVNAITTRSNFQFNPTNCNKMEVTGTIHSSEGSSDTIGVPFQVTNCAVLAFKPGFKVSTAGKTSRANGASLHVQLTYPKAPFGSQANIKSVKVDLPKQLPSRLTTLQKACPAKTFEANPAGCSADSIVGHAVAITPLIPVPLTGPAYFVSYGGAKFPELVIVLQGYGVTLNLHGETFISKAGITSSTFHTVPDAPVGSFELNLPQGKYSALAANGNLCKSKLAMPTAFTAQNGMEIHESTKIAVTGCVKHKTAKRALRRKKR